MQRVAVTRMHAQVLTVKWSDLSTSNQSTACCVCECECLCVCVCYTDMRMHASRMQPSCATIKRSNENNTMRPFFGVCISYIYICVAVTIMIIITIISMSIRRTIFVRSPSVCITQQPLQVKAICKVSRLCGRVGGSFVC